MNKIQNVKYGLMSEVESLGSMSPSEKHFNASHALEIALTGILIGLFIVCFFFGLFGWVVL